MAKSRFDRPTRLNIRETFVPQAVPLPFDQIQGAIQRRQQSFDQNEALLDEAAALVNVNAIPKDIERRDILATQFEDEFDKIIQDVEGDLSRAGGESKAFARKIGRSLTRGELGAIQARANSRQSYQATLQKALDEGKLKNPQKAQLLLQVSDATTPNLIDQNTGRFNGYNAINPAEEINYVERGLELTKELAKDGRGGFFMDDNGLLITKNGDFITRDKAFQASFEALLSDQASDASLNQDLLLTTALAGPMNESSLDQSIEAFKNSLTDRDLIAEIESIQNTSNIEGKAKLVSLLHASNAVANQRSFSDESISAKALPGFGDEKEKPSIESIQVPSQFLDVSSLTKPFKGSEFKLENGKVVNNINPSAEKFKLKTEVTGAVAGVGAGNPAIPSFLNLIGNVGAFFIQLFTPNQEIGEEDPDYRAVARNLRLDPNIDFDGMTTEEQNNLVANTMNKRMDTQESFNFELTPSSKDIANKNTMLFGNPDGQNKEGRDLVGGYTAFVFTNTFGEKFAGETFKQKVKSKPIRVIGTVNNINSPIEWGSTVLDIGGEHWFMSPTETDKTSIEYQNNRIMSARFSPSYRTVFEFGGRRFESIYNSIERTYDVNQLD